jgi:acetoin utilization deacetylase AcuC-like enzyme
MTTGYIYDPIFLKHTYPHHPEGAQRLQAIEQVLDEADLWSKLTQIPSRPARENELTLVHPPRYVSFIRSISERGGGLVDVDTYATVNSYQAAATAVGSLIDLTVAVVDGQLQNGFALVRPPGHHATNTQAMGFCLFSNVAIAARAVREACGVKRIAVVDFDVHHGNGTQDVLINEPDILFISSHQYPHYPGSGQIDEIGEGAAKGTVINLPLSIGVGDVGFKRLYHDIIIPAIRRFQPELILVSAGYDAHWDDPLAQLGLTLNGLGWLSQMLITLAEELCEGKIVFTLEGGYNLTALSHGVANSLRALLHRTDFSDPLGPSPWPEPDLDSLINRLKKLHHL